MQKVRYEIETKARMDLVFRCSRRSQRANQIVRSCCYLPDETISRLDGCPLLSRPLQCGQGEQR
jgi:hypothetical protein